MPRRDIVLYKYYPPERVDVLERRMIYFSHPSAFNDPFELEPYFRPYTHPFETLVADGLVNSGSTMSNVLNGFRPIFEKQRLNEANRHTLIFSTSEDGDNLLLWGHYAAGHTGFAVGFSSSASSFRDRRDGSSRRLSRVNYSYLRPAVNTVDELREQDMLLTKSFHWQYEKEWRMFESPFNSDENAPIKPGVWGFRLEPDSVDRVVFGARMSTRTRKRILDALKHPDFAHVKVIKAYLDDEEFAVKHRVFDDR